MHVYVWCAMILCDVCVYGVCLCVRASVSICVFCVFVWRELSDFVLCDWAVFGMFLRCVCI